MVFFFKQMTAYEMRISDWSSDVCSSDLAGLAERDDGGELGCGQPERQRLGRRAQLPDRVAHRDEVDSVRQRHADEVALPHTHRAQTAPQPIRATHEYAVGKHVFDPGNSGASR